MHHLLEIVVVLLVALIIGWIIGWFLRCVLFQGRDAQRAATTTDGRGKLGLLGASAAGAVAAGAGAGTGTAEGAGRAAATAGTAAGSKSAAGGEDAARKDAAGLEEPEKAAATATAASAAAAADEGQGEAAAGKEAPAYGLSAPIGGKADDLQMISGIGPKLEKMLHEQGIFHFSQIASWTDKDIAEINDKLQFKGRIEREEWVRQAKLLAAGKMEQFEKEYGTGGKKGADGKTRSGSRTRKGSTGKSASKTAGSAATKGASGKAGEGKAGKKEKLQAYGLSAPIGGKADDLQLISGIGPKLEKVLHDLGIYHYAQIASWTKKDIAEIDEKLKFKGRIERDEWVRQAKLLAAGKMEQFEKEYGTGGKKGADGKTRSGSRTRRK